MDQMSKKNLILAMEVTPERYQIILYKKICFGMLRKKLYCVNINKATGSLSKAEYTMAKFLQENLTVK